MFTQIRSTALVKTSFNRIGLSYNASFGVSAKNNQFELGVKIYGPDKVFEKNTLGFCAAYSYLFNAEKVFGGPSLGYAFFSEKKSNSTLHLQELSFGNTLGYKLGAHFALSSTIAIGVVLNSSKSDMVKTELNYLNYEISLGLSYYFGSSSR